MITGTMTQPTALQLVCQEKRCPVVAMHETCHIFAHEAQGYQMQQRFQVLPVGDRHRPWNVKDLKAWPDEIAAAVYELPMREIGGQLPSWQQLEESKHTVPSRVSTCTWTVRAYGNRPRIIRRVIVILLRV